MSSRAQTPFRSRAGRPGGTARSDGPGVPEAAPRTLQGALGRLGAASIDRLWLFPPRINGRKESGLIVVSRHLPDGDAERRAIITVSYRAERTGRGLDLDWTLAEEGTAPPDRLPPVVEGVVRRSGDEGPAPVEVAVRGRSEVLRAWFAELDDALLDPTLWPRSAAEPSAPEAEAERESHERTEATEEAEPT